MNKVRKWTYLTCLMLIGLELHANDPQFTQFYANQMYLNPAFTGNTPMGRLSTIHRKQWMRVPGAYTSRAFAYDHFLPKSNSGLGFMVVTDQAGLANLSFKSFAGAYAYNLPITRRQAVRFGVRAGSVWRSADFSQLTFTDQLESGSVSSVEQLSTGPLTYFDISFGAVYYNRRMWLGLAADHVNQPDQAFATGDIAKLPMKYSVHGGYMIPTQFSNKKEITQSWRFAFLYKAQQDWDQLDLGLYFTNSPMVFGFWYRGLPLVKSYEPGYPNHDAIAFLSALEIREILWVGYSYDVTISWLRGRTAGSHEVSLVYEYITKKQKRYKKRNVPCARF